SLCLNCHNSRKRYEERHGFRRDVGPDGYPLKHANNLPWPPTGVWQRQSKRGAPTMRVNLAHLSPLRRGYVIGFMRARCKARVELRALAADYDAELVDLLRELGEIRDAPPNGRGRLRAQADGAGNAAALSSDASPVTNGRRRLLGDRYSPPGPGSPTACASGSGRQPAGPGRLIGG